MNKQLLSIALLVSIVGTMGAMEQDKHLSDLSSALLEACKQGRIDCVQSLLASNNADVNTRTLDMHIVRLRKKIETNADSPQYLQTVRGIGYKFVYAG